MSNDAPETRGVPSGLLHDVQVPDNMWLGLDTNLTTNNITLSYDYTERREV